jgi:enoyl-CoA hydratase
MSGETIEYGKIGATGVVTLSRPGARNAMNSRMLSELEEALDGIEKDAGVRVVVLRGRGRGFCAGADIAEMRANDPAAQREMSGRFARLNGRIEEIRKPFIASVHGFALGGGAELALCCDLVVAADDAEFGFPEILVGVMPGGGALARLLRRAGIARAMELAMTGVRIGAEEARKSGLVNRVVDPGRLEEETMALAAGLEKKPPLALGAVKATLNLGLDVDLRKGAAAGLREFLALFGTRDREEGMSAFLEKREAVFRGE